MVSWLGKTCVFSAGVHRHAPGNITDWHLVTLQTTEEIHEKIETEQCMETVSEQFIAYSPYMFLNTQLLELDKFGASGLQVESTSRFVGDTLLAGTHDEGHEGGRLDLKDKNTLLWIPDRYMYCHGM